MCEPLNILTLAAAMHFYPDEAVQLYRVAGSATAVMDNRRNLRDILPACPQTAGVPTESRGYAGRRLRGAAQGRSRD